MGFFADFVMLYNIKPLSLHRVFHGIRFKVNEDWESGKIPFFYAHTKTPNRFHGNVYSFY